MAGQDSLMFQRLLGPWYLRFSDVGGLAILAIGQEPPLGFGRLVHQL